ncbi:MAG: YggS family pyridoxal phosphate-dependent enzyme [Deferribacteraceae bacterium]|jgi:pyridoxal phosphate enzyme (YggS family)|nr:YggS family pyridoxal phosphate-dependent enzyme [Deferribacteraceae bacterium]
MTFTELKERIDNSARKRGAKGEDISIVTVSKGRSVEAMLKLAEEGAEIFGESRLQEALLKIPRFPAQNFHFIGRLQSNKIKEAVKHFEMIQSVDNLDAAQLINSSANRFGKIQKVMIQVNISGEKQKGGILKEYLSDLYKSVVKLPNISLEGLMMIPPYFDDPEENRLLFREMFKIYKSYTLPYLSMGMSGDFESAVEEGANMVRVGSALFEN